MRKVSLIVFLALLSSCVTQRRCSIKFPIVVNSSVKETVRDSIVYRDTVIYVGIPGELRTDSIPIPCSDVLGYIPQKVYAETSLARASAWWSYPNIKLELIQKDTTIERRLDNALKEAYHWQSEYEKITVTPQPLKYIPGIYKVAFWLWISVILSGIGYITLRFFVFKK